MLMLHSWQSFMKFNHNNKSLEYHIKYGMQSASSKPLCCRFAMYVLKHVFCVYFWHWNHFIAGNKVASVLIWSEDVLTSAYAHTHACIYCKFPGRLRCVLPLYCSDEEMSPSLPSHIHHTKGKKSHPSIYTTPAAQMHLTLSHLTL